MTDLIQTSSVQLKPFFAFLKVCANLCRTLTSVVVEVRQGFLVRQYYGLVLRDDLSPQILPAGGQLPQLLQLTHPADKMCVCEAYIMLPLKYI